MADEHKGPTLAIMLGVGKPKHSPMSDSSDTADEEDSEPQDEKDAEYSDELDAVAGDLADAIASGDTEEIKKKLIAFKECKAM